MLQRKYWIDWCKIYGIYLVALGHFSPQVDTLHLWFYTFHIPLFFIISGYLSSSKVISFSNHLRNNTKTLIVPYFILVFIGWCIDMVCNGFSNVIGGGQDLLLSVIGLPGGHVNPMWFVFCLFMVKIIDAFLGQINNKTIATIFVIVIIILALLLTEGVIPLKRPLIWFIVATPFYWVGKILKNRDKLFIAKNNLWKVVICILGLSLPLAFSLINERTDMYFCMFGRSGILYYLFGIVASIVVLIVSENILDIKSELITTLSKGTLMIVAFHRYLLWPLELLNFNECIFVRVFYPLIVVLLFYYPIRLTLKHMPIILGNRK